MADASQLVNIILKRTS